MGGACVVVKTKRGNRSLRCTLVPMKYGSYPTPIWKLALPQEDCTFVLTKKRFNEMY